MRNFKKYLQEADARSNTSKGSGFNEFTGEVENNPEIEQLKKALEALKDYPPEVRAELEKQIRQAYEQQKTQPTGLLNSVRPEIEVNPNGVLSFPTKPNSNVIDVDKLTKEQKQELLRLEKEVNPKAAGPIRFQSTFDPRFYDGQQMIFDPNSPEYRAYRADLAKLGFIQNEDEKAVALAADPDVSELEKFMKASQEAAIGILAARTAGGLRKPGTVMRFNSSPVAPVPSRSTIKPIVTNPEVGRTRPGGLSSRTAPTTPPTSGIGTAHRTSEAPPPRVTRDSIQNPIPAPPIRPENDLRPGEILFGTATPEQIRNAARQHMVDTGIVDPLLPPTEVRPRPEQPKPRTTPTTPTTSGVGTRHTTPSGPDLGPPSGGGAGGGGGGTTTRAPTRPFKVVSTSPSKSTVKFPTGPVIRELLPYVGIPNTSVTSIPFFFNQQQAPEPGDVIIAPPVPPEVKPEEIPSIPGILPPEVEPDERKKPQPIAPPAPVTPPSKPSAPPEEKPVPKPTPPGTEPGEKPDVKPVPGPTKPATEPGEQPSTPPVPAPKPEPPAVPKPEKPAPTGEPSAGTAAGTGEKPKETPKDQGTPKKEPQPPFTPDPVKPTPPTPPTAPPPAPAAPPSPKKPPVVVPTSPQGETGGVALDSSAIDGGGRAQMFVSGLAGSADSKSGGIVTRFTYEVFEPETLISSARFSLINEAICNSPVVRMIKIKKIVEEMKEKEMPEIIEDECPSDLGSESSQMFVSTQPETTSGRSEEIKFKK